MNSRPVEEFEWYSVSEYELAMLLILFFKVFLKFCDRYACDGLK